MLIKYYGITKKTDKESVALKKRILGLPIGQNNKIVIFDEEVSRFELFIDGLGYGARSEFKWYREMEQRFANNSFTLENDNTGISLLLLASLIKRNDETANAKITFTQGSSGGLANVVATRAIKKNDEITFKN